MNYFSFLFLHIVILTIYRNSNKKHRILQLLKQIQNKGEELDFQINRYAINKTYEWT